MQNGSIVPPEGAPGSTVAAPSQPQAETLPTNPGTIVATGSINTLDQILCANWIYDATFTVSTSQAPGTIVYSKKIHPRNWNWVTDHVSKLFNCYTGAGSVRYRPVATVWYGGSIRVGFLPPSVTEEQLRTIPLEVLTTFPNRDIDPKNTGWVEFSPPDERNIMYHYMDDQGRDGFGGWIVFYVAARLVTQSPEYTTIQMLVENKGGYMFDQVSPFAISKVVQSSDPLGSLAQIPLSQQTLCDSRAPVTAIQIEQSSTIVIPYPGFNHAAIGYPKVTQSGTKAFSTIQKVDATIADVTSSMSIAATNSRQGYGASQSGGTPVLDSITMDYARIDKSTGEIKYHIPQSPSVVLNIPQIKEDSVGSVLDILDLTGRDLFTQGTAKLTPSTITRTRNESIVVFTDNQLSASYNTQTNEISALAGSFEADNATTYLYQLISPSGTPLNYIRLWPDGLLTTNATASRLLIPVKTGLGTTAGYTLRYLSELSPEDPIPPVPATFLAIKPLLAKLAKSTDIDLIQDVTNY